MKTITYLIIIASISLLIGCGASVPPTELINARAAYQHASAGKAAQLVPAELHKAKVALAIAEKSFQDDPQSFQTRDLAYVADRKAKMAEALAATALGNATTAKANQDYQATQTEIVKNTKEDLAISERVSALKTERIAAEQKVVLETEARRVKQQDEADTEARLVKESTDAEARRIKDLADAETRRLNTIITFEKGGVVILRGVNFESNKATITKYSENILWDAYNAMIANPNVNVVISGHTDDVGSEKANQVLSLKRAQAVKNWLVKNGIKSNRMRTVGKGESEPVASNNTEDGRLENRRMEFYAEK